MMSIGYSFLIDYFDRAQMKLLFNTLNEETI